jgi:hypothetical protein
VIDAMRMSPLRRWIVVGVLAVAALAFADQAGLARAAGLDLWNLPKLERQLKEQEDLVSRFDAEFAILSHRMAAKDALVRDLVAGRATLAGTADEFLALNAGHPETMSVLRDVHSTDDAREMSARNVIDFVRLHRFPSRAAKAAALDKLNAEFALLFPAAGTPR